MEKYAAIRVTRGSYTLVKTKTIVFSPYAARNAMNAKYLLQYRRQQRSMQTRIRNIVAPCRRLIARYHLRAP